MVKEQSRDSARIGSHAGRVRLIDAVPDLVGFLTADERLTVEQIFVPVISVEKGAFELSESLGSRGAFAAVVVDGLVLQYLAIAAEPGLLILGPGDVVLPARASAPELLTSTRYRAPAPTRLALLGTDALIAAGRAPRVMLGLLDVVHRQRQRLATQLVICQLPRVADRVQAMLWLLAESFGRVTPSGTRLPLSLTHEVLGALVGARRPTVTLALGELAERGAVVHQDGGWLLLEPPPMIGEIERRRILEEPGLSFTSRPPGRQLRSPRGGRRRRWRP